MVSTRIKLHQGVTVQNFKKNLFPFWRLAAGGVVLTLVNACGGGSSAPTPAVSTPTAASTSTTTLPTPSTTIPSSTQLPTGTVSGQAPPSITCPYGQTAGAGGVCYPAPTILPRNVSILNDDTFLLKITDVNGDVPLLTTPNATGSGSTTRPLIAVYGISPDAIKVTDSAGAVLPSSLVVGNVEPGSLEGTLKVTLKNSKIEYSKTYTFSLVGLAGYPNGNAFYTASVAFTTPVAPWSIPQTCGPTKSSPCTIDSTCTIQNKCWLDPETKHYLPNKKDSKLVYVLSNLGPNPIENKDFTGYRIYSAYAISGQYIARSVSSNEALSAVLVSGARIDYAFFDTDGYLYISSISNLLGTSRHCQRIALQSDGGVAAWASIRQSICENGVPSPWTIPLGKEISLACTKTQRCALDETGVYFAESPRAFEREVGVGRAISNRGINCYSSPSADVTMMWYYRSIGPDVCDNGKFGFGAGFIPSFQGAASKLGPIRSAFWDGGFLYYELNQPNSCLKFGDAVDNAKGEVALVTCPQ
jgi:hypothetical protein